MRKDVVVLSAVRSAIGTFGGALATIEPAELAAMRAIKNALDPLHLLNPGKVFDL